MIDTSYYSTGYNSYNTCHVGLKFCFEHKGIRFYGAGWKNEKLEIMEAGFKGALLIDLDDNVKKTLSFQGLKAHSLRKLASYHDPACIKIYWPDYGTPALGNHFFERLLACIKEENRDVIVFCFGGHGRTGTCLSILAGLLGITDDPISLIRKTVCGDCVESEAQLAFVHKMTGCKTAQHKISKYLGYSPQKDFTKPDKKIKDDKKDKEVDRKDGNGDQSTAADVSKYSYQTGEGIYLSGKETPYLTGPSELIKHDSGAISICGSEGNVVFYEGSYYWSQDGSEDSVLFPLNKAEIDELKALKLIA